MSSSPPRPARVLGVDGARDGWVVADFDPGSGDCSLRLVETIASVATSLRRGEYSVAAVDMPIGLSADGNRPVDALVRTRLGARRATFFPTPVRSVLTSASWEEANACSRKVSGKGLSKQSWNLIPKIAELDAEWTPDLCQSLLEAHPEATFAQMAGTPLLSKKSTTDGERDRVGLLVAHLSPDIPVLLSDIPRRWRVDAVDALALAWTAARASVGTAIWLGGELDPLGRPMQLVI